MAVCNVRGIIYCDDEVLIDDFVAPLGFTELYNDFKLIV